MTSPIELACLLDTQLSTTPQASEVICSILPHLKDCISDPDSDAAGAFSDILFEIYPSLIKAAALGPQCEALIIQIIALAAKACSPRELFTLLQSTISEYIQEDNVNYTFHLHLLHSQLQCLQGMQRRLILFTSDYLAGCLHWAETVLPNCHNDLSENNSTTLEARALFSYWTQFLQYIIQSSSGLDERSSNSSHTCVLLSQADRQHITSLIAGAALQLVSTLLQLPPFLQTQESAVYTLIPKADAAIGNKFKVYSPLLEESINVVVHPCVQLIEVAVQDKGGLGSVQGFLEAGLRANLTDTDSNRVFLDGREVELGAAVVLAWALKKKLPLPGGRPGVISILWLLEQSKSAAEVLIDLAAQHQSIFLGLLPLYTISLAAQYIAATTGAIDGNYKAAQPNQDNKGAAGARRSHLQKMNELLNGIVEAVVAVMSYNPVQLLRTAAHEAWEQLFAAVPAEVRLHQLQHMMQVSPTAATIAFQRLKADLASPQPSSNNAYPQSNTPQQNTVLFKKQVLELVQEVIQQEGPMGWYNESGVLEKADALAAALSVIRLLLLQHHSNINKEEEYCVKELTSQIVKKDVVVLKACVERVMEVQNALNAQQAQQVDADGKGEGGIGIELESRLAVMRLYESLRCVIEAHDNVAVAV